MITQSNIKSLIDKVSEKYQQCWIMLRRIKMLEGNQTLENDILNFQPVLCKAMLQLEKVHQTIAQEKESLIQKKRDLSIAWFNRRMKTLARYQDALEKCLCIGKALGDSFAWIFYENERHLLVEHLKHDEVLHLPSGIGGIGEMAFIEKAQGLGKCLIIYHGITTFLRLGDVSFFDFSSGRIVDLGELKTRQIDNENVEVTIVFAGWQPEKPSMPIWQENPTLGTNSSQLHPLLTDLPTKMKSRLGRQLRAMASSLSQRDKKPDREKAMNGQMHIEELNQLYLKLKTSRFIYQKAGSGLLLMGYRNRAQSLSAKLVGRSQISLEKKLGDFQNNVYTILDQTEKDNIIYRSLFYYDEQGKVASLAGTVPVFWWPLDIEFIKAVIFQDVVIITIFNPIHFIKKLKDSGWKTERSEATGAYTAIQETMSPKMKIENFSYFMKLIQNHLFREEAVVEIINDAIGTIGQESLPANIKVELSIQQFFR